MSQDFDNEKDARKRFMHTVNGYVLRENPNLLITKSRERPWKERLFSWPWEPHKRYAVWTEPDPDVYKVGNWLLGHPDTLRNLAREIVEGVK